MHGRRRLETTLRHLAPEAVVTEASHVPSSQDPLLVLIDGQSLTPEQLYSLGHNQKMKVDLTNEAWNRVR